MIAADVGGPETACTWDADDAAAVAAEELRKQYETRSAYEHHEDNTRSAARAFASCRIVDRSEGRWVLAPFDAEGVRRGGRTCEVAVLNAGLVVVHGYGCHFAAFTARGTKSARASIEVIGSCGQVWMDVADRLADAMGRGLERRLDAAVFRHEAIDYLLVDGDEPSDVSKSVEALEDSFAELVSGAGDGGVLGAQRSLFDDIDEDEPGTVFMLGRVYEDRVYEGHAALARLSAMLADEDAAARADCSTDAGRAVRLLSAVRGPGHAIETWAAPGSARAWVVGPGGKAHEEGAGTNDAEALAALVSELRREAAGRIERGAGGVGMVLREALEAAYVPLPGAPSRKGVAQ